MLDKVLDTPLNVVAFSYPKKILLQLLFQDVFGFIKANYKPNLICRIPLIGNYVCETNSNSQPNEDRYCHTVNNIFQYHKEEFIFQ